jgi:hypothetical protein
MRKFLEGEEVIRSTKQIPAALRKPIEFAEYNGYKFAKDELLRQLDVEQLSKEFGERDRNGDYSDDSNFKKVYSGLADALIARTRIPDPIFQSAFDEQAALKTLSLVERAYAGRSGDLGINIDRWYGSPLVLDGILLEMDFCWDVDYTPPPEEIAGGMVTGKCECKCNTNCVQQNPCCAKITPYVADLYVVKDYLRCYEVGEMSYIENVIQSEVRERKVRTLEREEFLTERTEEMASFDEKDHQVEEKFSLEKEIESTVKQELSLDTGVTLNYRWGTGDLKMTTDIGYNLTKQDAQKSVQKSAKETMDKAISRLETKVREFSSRKFFRESEETNKHTFGGTDGAPNDISRQFYYVNSLRRAQVYNYGRRMLLDLYVPEPSELYKRLVKKQFTLTKPVKPAVTPKQITEENYLTYVETYGLTDVEPPAAPAQPASVSFSGGTGEAKQAIDFRPGLFGIPTPTLVWNGSGSDVKPDTVVVPNGYELDSMTTSFGDVHFNGVPGVNSSLAVDLGGQNLFIDSNGGSSQFVQWSSSVDGAQAIAASSMNTTSYKLLVVVNFRLKAEERLKWQTGIYDKIMEGYQKELADYEEALKKSEEGGERVNPFLLLEDIKEQLKQATISYISCQFFDSMNAMRQKVEPCGFPQPDLQEAKREGEFVRFFEQAFEWKFMNFVLYPYFWGRKCSWEEKKKQESDNLLFQRFLQAGYAGVSISVRPGFEGHVNYFLKTKQIWGKTGQPPVAGPDFVPIYQEIKEDKDNFNTDRVGKIDVTNGSNVVTLNGTDQYWNYGNPSAQPPIAGFADPQKIAADIDREIFIDCKQYRIVGIQTYLNLNSWTITLDRPYEGVTATGLPWSTGALFIGAPWEFRIPTRLVWLREDARCLPCYPIECEE